MPRPCRRSFRRANLCLGPQLAQPPDACANTRRLLEPSCDQRRPSPDDDLAKHQPIRRPLRRDFESGYEDKGGYRGPMKSSITKRSVVIGRHKTSVSLEDAFWRDLKEIAQRHQSTLSKLIAQIDETREQG